MLNEEDTQESQDNPDSNSDAKDDDNFSASDFKDEDDPSVLKQKLSQLEKEKKTLDKRYRDMQGLSQRTKNRSDAIVAALEKRGLTFDEHDKDLVKKPIDLDKSDKYPKDRFVEEAAKDPVSAIEKLVGAEIEKRLAQNKRETAEESKRREQMEDKEKIMSLPGAEDIQDTLFKIIEKEDLMFAKNPFTQALLVLGDQDMINALRKKSGKGNIESDKLAATVARGGGRTSESNIEYTPEQLKSMPFEKLEKIAKEVSRRQGY